MSDVVFSARFTPGASVPVSSTVFNVAGVIFDGNGLFSASDIQVNDIVYLDCFASITAPGTVSRYKVILINSASGFNCNLRLQYDDTGTPIDPAEVAGSPGYIARPAAGAGLMWHAAPTVHTFSDYITQYARNQESKALIDGSLGGGGGAKAMIAGEAIAAGKPVSKRASDGKVVKADSDGSGTQNFIGISTTSAAGDGSAITVRLLGANVAGVLTGLGFVTGDEIFMDETAGAYTNGAGVDAFTGANDSILRLGMADCAAGSASTTAVDLIMFPEVITRP